MSYIDHKSWSIIRIKFGFWDLSLLLCTTNFSTE